LTNIIYYLNLSFMDLKTKVKDLHQFPKNPRKINAVQQRILEKTINEYGDLSGIVFNSRLNQLVGGHQRCNIFSPSDEIVIVEKFDSPDDQGTLALGYVLHDDKKYSYRVVSWDEQKHTAGSIAANKGGGDWDWTILKELQQELDTGAFDMELTGFDLTELENLLAGDTSRLFEEPEEKGDPSNKEEDLKKCPNCGCFL